MIKYSIIKKILNNDVYSTYFVYINYKNRYIIYCIWIFNDLKNVKYSPL